MAMPEVNIALMDSQGGFYALTSEAGELMDAALAVGGLDDAEFTYSGKHYIAQEGSLTPLGLTAVFFYPIDERLESLLYHRRLFVILTVVAAGLLGCYLIFFKRAVFTPMKAVYAAMERMGEDNEFRVDERSNEFRTIYDQFARMIERVKNLSAEVYEEKFRAQQAEMMQLQMQIRPHFFYNTLFSIYRMAQHEGSEDIAFLSQHLSSYYAYITRAPRDVVPLSSEINHMSDYLEIQRFRFGRRITVTVDSLPEEISRERIPPLVIQPLVENAFEHGLHDKEEDGQLNVSFQWSSDSFCVIVTDNGGRMDEVSVTKLRAALEQGTLHESSALMNLHRRLQIRYGKGYGLSLSSVNNSLRAVVSFGRHNKSDELEE
jgi:two-component system sensor histidine kinase YesM